MVWVQLLWFVVTTVISIALAPKPKAPRQAAIDDFAFPTAEEGRPIPVVFGTVDISGANVLWYGDLRTTKIKKSSGFSSQTVGYKYYIGFHLGLCYGPVDEVSRVVWGDKDVWFGSITGNASDAIVQNDAFGGQNREGGVWGDFDIMMGGNAQTPNTYLAAKMGGEVPAFRGILSFVWKNGYVGTTSYVKPLAIRVKRTAAGWQGSTWYPETVELPDGSMNPAHMVYQLLTDAEWGMGVPTSFLNDQVFRDTADNFFERGFGLSMLWNQQASIQDFLQIILDHVGASLALRNDTGQYELMPITGDYDVDDLPVLGAGDIKEVSDYQRQGWGNTVNEVTLVYTDPDTRKDTTVSAQDLGNAEAQGGRIPAIVELRGITSHDVAREVVARELQARVTPIAQLTLIAMRKAWRLPYNDVFVLNWPPLNIEAMVVRILSINRGTLEDGYISVRVVEDIFAEELAMYLGTNDQEDDPDAPPTPADDPDPGIGVISTTTHIPPVNPYAGDRWWIPLSPPATGAWAGHEGEFVEPDGEGGWIFTPAPDGTFLFDAGSGTTYQVQGGVLTIPWTPPIPGLFVYPDSAIDEADVQLVGYSLADSQYYKFPVSQLPIPDPIPPDPPDAVDVPYDNSTSGLTASDVQAAIDLLDARIGTGGGGGGGGVPEAPIDGARYARKNGAWEAIDATVGWITVNLGVGGSDSTGWNGYTLRQVFSDLGVGAGSKVRITVKAPSTGPLTIDDSYVGAGALSGDQWDYAATPQRVTWNTGSNSVTIPTGTYITSDEITFTTPLDGLHNLVFSFYFATSGSIRAGFTANPNAFLTGAYKLASDAATVNASGYTGYGTAVVQRVEIFKP